MKPIITNAYRDKDGNVMIETFEISVHNTRFWCLNNILHRVDGPAIEWFDGEKEWCFNGETHRINGPAIERSDGSKWWYFDNVKYSEQEYWNKIKEMDGSNNVDAIRTNETNVTSFCAT